MKEKSQVSVGPQGEYLWIWAHNTIFLKREKNSTMCEHGHHGVMRVTAPEAAVCEMHHYQQLEPRLLSPRLAPPVSSLATRLTGLEGQCPLSPPACCIQVLLSLSQSRVSQPCFYRILLETFYQTQTNARARRPGCFV